MISASKSGEVVSLIFRIVVGAVFILSAVSKFISIETFEAVLRQYQMLPAGWLRPFAHVLPIVELVTGTFVLLGLFLRPAIAIVGIQLIMFLGALGLALARGIDLSDCGCFAGFGWQETPGQAIGRDIILLGMTAWLWWKPSTRLTLDAWFAET